MAITLNGIYEGIEILDNNTDTGVALMQGAGAPGGDAGKEDAAGVGSQYWDRTNGVGYHKDTAGTGTDKWVRVTDDTYFALLLGISEGDVDMGTFTGTILTDNTTIKALLQELEVDLDAIQTLSGVAAEATDLGTFTGSTISDNRNIKEALQDLETQLELVGAVEGTSAAITTGTTVDTVLVDAVIGVEYLVVAELDSDPTQRQLVKIVATHDGDTGDATETDYTVYSKTKTANFDFDVDIVLAGTGAAQTMGLEITAAAAITIRFRREEV